MARIHKQIADSEREGDRRYISAKEREDSVSELVMVQRSLEKTQRELRLDILDARLNAERAENNLREELSGEFYTLAEAVRVTGLERRKLTNRVTYGRIFGMKILGEWWLEKEATDSYIEED